MKTKLRKKVKTAFDLGITASDIITGFTGTVTGFATYLTGCNQYSLTPKCKEDDKYPKGEWFDESRLEEIKEEEKIVISNTGDPGACGEAPIY